MVEEEKVFRAPEEKKAEKELKEEKTLEEKKEVGEVKKEKEIAELKKEAPKEPAKKEEQKPKAKEEKKEAEKEEKKREIVLERLYVAPLGKAFDKPRSHSAKTAARLLKQFAAKNLKVEKTNVRIKTDLINVVQKRGAKKPLRKIRVKATKDKEGIVWIEKA